VKLIAFAHLTIAGHQSSLLSSSGYELIKNFKNVPNSNAKKKIMITDSATHDINIFRGNFDLEVNSYDKSRFQHAPEISLEILQGFDNSSVIESVSFTLDFFQQLNELFELENKTVKNEATFRTLNPIKPVTLKYSKNGPPFGSKVDAPGMASAAFYVVNINSGHQFSDGVEIGDVFKVSLRDSTYMIRFVKCGEVWVELIQRT